MGRLLGALLLVVLVAAAEGKTFAVLVASSRGYLNYRHQADVCHAYHLLKGSVDHVTTMAYGDAATSYENPFPGKLFNSPNGSDVSCHPDYSGSDVTPDTFLSVLANLPSGGNDRIFVYFVDHGGVGFVLFPTGLLHATDLQATLRRMHAARKYREMVFFLEACEGGSMFDSLPDTLNIYASAAARPTETSAAIYCPPNDTVEGRDMNTCLADQYSTAWMTSLSPNLTLQEQYRRVAKETTNSHPTVYGSLALGDRPLSDFLGNVTSLHLQRDSLPTATPARSVSLALAISRARRAAPADRPAAVELLNKEMNKAAHAQKLFHGLARLYGKKARPARTLIRKDCHRHAHEAVMEHCGGYTEYSLPFSHVVVDLCEEGHPSVPHDIASFCQKHIVM